MLKKKIWPNFPTIIEVFTQKIVTKTSKIWVWDPGSEIRDPEKTYSGSRIHGSKRHRIPDPDQQHWYKYESFERWTNLWGFLTPPVEGALFLAALVASCFLGALPPVDLRAVCLVRAIFQYWKICKLLKRDYSSQWQLHLVTVTKFRHVVSISSWCFTISPRCFKFRYAV